MRWANRIHTTARNVASLAGLPLLLSAALIAAVAMSPASGSGSGKGTGSGSLPTLTGSTAASTRVPYATSRQVEAAVAQASSLRTIPKDVQPPLQSLTTRDVVGSGYQPKCTPPDTFVASESVPDCTFGDPEGTRTIVLTGDSRAEMWFDTLNAIAIASKMKLVLLSKNGCPAAIGSFRVNDNGTLSNASWPACTAWHKYVVTTIRALAPAAVIVSSSVDLELTDSGSGLATPKITGADFATFFGQLPTGPKLVVLAGFPSPGSSGLSPTICLSKGPASIQSCSFRPNSDESQRNAALVQAATRHGASVVDEAPWFCARVCPAIIHGTVVYTVDAYHIDGYYTTYLTGVLGAALKPDLS